MGRLVMCVETGHVLTEDEPREPGRTYLPVIEAEPYYEQVTRSRAEPTMRTGDGFDKSSLSPEHAWRIGRDYFAHALRYGWPMRIIRDSIGVGARILEVGAGAELPLFRALTCDLSATTYYKPSLYVAADLNAFKYHPQVSGIETHLLPSANIIERPPAVFDHTFDLVVSFEVLEHMDKPDGELFLDALVDAARNKCRRENRTAIIALSTPVCDGHKAKNHVYEWRRTELERAWIRRGVAIKQMFGCFANLRDLVDELTPDERSLWNKLADFHSPHVLSTFFATAHPTVARNIAWEVEVQP